MNCMSCGADTTNGLALCERCQIAASVYLEFLPVHFRNLARWRPGQAGSRPVPGSREPRMVGVAANDVVSRTLDEVGADIIGWARSLSDDRGVELPERDDEATSVVAACRLLAEHMTSIATLEWGGTFVTTAGEHEATLRRLSERVVPGWYAGGCKQCGSGTYVVPGLTWVTCGCCGVTTYARDHLETILDEAAGWVARPMALAQTIVALVDTEVSVPRLHKRISKWGERGRIESLRRVDDDGDEVGPKRFRLGEVLDALFAEGATRLDGEVEARAS